MTIGEHNHDTVLPPPNPEEVFEGLMYGVEAYYMDALRNREQTPGVLWVKSGRIQGNTEEDDERVMWFRVGEHAQLTLTSDTFDIGVVVQDPEEHNPRPIEAEPGQRHFYVRHWHKKGPHVKSVSATNALAASAEAPLILKHSSIKGLAHKLETYHLHNMGVWDTKGDGFNHDAA